MGIEHLELQGLKEDGRFLRAVFEPKPGAPTTSIVPDPQDTSWKARLDETNSEIDVLKNRGARELSQHDRFKLADLTNFYGAIYWDLCRSSHNNIRTLESRHLVANGHGVRVVGGTSLTPEEMRRIADVSSWILVQTLMECHSSFTCGPLRLDSIESSFEALAQALRALGVATDTQT